MTIYSECVCQFLIKSLQYIRVTLTSFQIIFINADLAMRGTNNVWFITKFNSKTSSLINHDFNFKVSQNVVFIKIL